MLIGAHIHDTRAAKLQQHPVESVKLVHSKPLQHSTDQAPRAACSGACLPLRAITPNITSNNVCPRAACSGPEKHPNPNPNQSSAAVFTDLTGRAKKTTQVCVKFREGREVCKKGASCRKLHITPKKICTNPSYQETGICSNWSKCRCRHPWDEEKWGSHNDAYEKYLKLQAK